MRPDGSVRWMRSCAFPIKDPVGHLSSFAGLAEDITERKHAEETLRNSEQRFRTFVDHATDAFFLQDDSGVILDVNRQACESLGYTREELVGKTPADFDPDVTPAMLEELRAETECQGDGRLRIPPSAEGRNGIPGRGPRSGLLGRRPTLPGVPGPRHQRAQAGRSAARRPEADSGADYPGRTAPPRAHGPVPDD